MPNQHHAREGMKDTIESIVIALVLAFVFRAFVVEAFVIPTGSMAPTLYGAHATIICEDCGYEFAYGLTDPDDKRGGEKVTGDRAAALCPNCNHVNSNLQVQDDRGLPEKGDRILVLKWPFDLGGRGLDPARWDVIVFKDPSDGTTNFIKRCAGVPNEVLAVIDGDVYTAPLSELSAETRAELEKQVHEKHLLVSGQKNGVLAPVSDVAFAELDLKFKIPRKSEEAQKVLWFPVYDHDHPPRTLDQYQPHWLPAHGERSGWEVSGAQLHFDPLQQPVDYVILAGKEIRAGNSYNVRAGALPPVSDQRVRFVLTPQDGQGAVRIRLTKWRRSFWANIHMDGTITLSEGEEQTPDSGPFMATAKGPPFQAGKPAALEFENLDYRLAVRVDGSEVLTSSSDPKSPAFYAPNLTALRKSPGETTASPPRIYGEQGSFDVTHLAVDRDEYYYHESRVGPLLHSLRWAPRLGWGSAISPIMLREGEYFMLGDNTAASKDSRLWDVVGPHLRTRGEEFQLGTVPRDQLIGKSFFVYWPSGHRVDWLPLLNRFGLIPDVGRMRWIR